MCSRRRIQVNNNITVIHVFVKKNPLYGSGVFVETSSASFILGAMLIFFVSFQF